MTAMGKWEKKISLAFLVFVLTLNVLADIPTEIGKLMGKDGLLISEVNGTIISDEDGANCRIVGGEGSASLLIDTEIYLKPTVILNTTRKELINGAAIYFLEDTGAESEEIMCGKGVPLVSYKKTLEVQGNTLLIRQKYRCLLEKPVEIVQGCYIPYQQNQFIHD